MLTVNGIRVIENPLIERQPRMQVSAEFRRLQSPTLVEETNRWMLKFFGTHRPAYIADARVFGMGHGIVLVVHPESLAVLRGANNARAALSPISPI